MSAEEWMKKHGKWPGPGAAPGLFRWQPERDIRREQLPDEIFQHLDRKLVSYVSEAQAIDDFIRAFETAVAAGWNPDGLCLPTSICPQAGAVCPPAHSWTPTDN